MTRALGTALLAGLSLVLSFAAAEVTGARWVGAVVLLAGGAWCVAREVRVTAWWRLALVVAVAVVGFVLSHRWASTLGPWGSVLRTSAAVAVVAWALLRSSTRSAARVG